MGLRISVFVLMFAVFAFVACLEPGGGSNRAGGAAEIENAPVPRTNPPSVTDAEWREKHKLPVEKIKLPDGFKIDVFAYGITNARSLCLSPSGTLFVGNRRNNGNVYALKDTDGDFRADEVYVIAENLFMPNGVAFRDGDLYVAEVNRVIVFRDIENRLAKPPAYEVVTDVYPSDTHHGWKFIRFGPDGKLYVPVGAPCNACVRPDPYAGITRINPDGGEFEIVARGVRNTVGFDWHPVTKELWFTDNGRDMLGDDIPPDELNHAPRPGLHFGFPYFHGKDVVDPEFGISAPDGDYTPAAMELGPHVAALGMRFYTGDMFPSEYRNQIFIAEHGSWNRTVPLGARVTLVKLGEDGMAKSYHVFAEGWQDAHGQRWGRPVDVELMPDGSMLVSDDHAGAIYRISYQSD